MQLTLFTDIALKAIMYIKQSQDLVTIDEIAGKFKVPRNHLTKVLNFMVHQKWISSVRGRDGGLFYNLSSEDLKLGDMVMILENKTELLDCNSCLLHANCDLRGVLHGAVNAFYGYLNQYTLKDLNLHQTNGFIRLVIKNSDMPNLL